MLNNDYEYRVCKVIDNKEISEGIFKISLEGSFVGKPGQFYMLRCWDKEPLLWRPISIHKITETSIEFLYQLVGDGTKLISKLKTGEEVKVIGPLGNGFNLDEIKGKVAVVSGGIGVAPMRELINNITGATVDVFSGFRDQVYGLDELKAAGLSVKVSTEDGSEGHEGYVTELFDPKDYDLVLCCGPEVMMYRVVKICKEAGTKVYISEEKKMACGIGACLVCTCKTIHGNKRTCKDGPVFNGEDLEV
ncbi:dihydroorotate dehydrogenase electron transfer subunit [Clostridium sp.]|uniref:dihydroorotate dehydrogenase electron transfer subunit n=1 Tax=Clostridium sp. TaxID=1506 RepID=UPI003217E488